MRILPSHAYRHVERATEGQSIVPSRGRRHATNLKPAPTDSLLLSPPSIHGLLAYRTARILTERKQTQHDQQKYNN
jgi:hypothetical protein